MQHAAFLDHHPVLIVIAWTHICLIYVSQQRYGAIQIYIYIYIERERERGREMQRDDRAKQCYAKTRVVRIRHTALE